MDKLEITDAGLKIKEIVIRACMTGVCLDTREILGRLPNLLFRRPVIERAPGVKIFHRGWQVGQTTQK